jgi:regulator of replication initiation timing
MTSIEKKLAEVVCQLLEDKESTEDRLNDTESIVTSLHEQCEKLVAKVGAIQDEANNLACEHDHWKAMAATSPAPVIVEVDNRNEEQKAKRRGETMALAFDAAEAWLISKMNQSKLASQRLKAFKEAALQMQMFAKEARES